MSGGPFVLRAGSFFVCAVCSVCTIEDARLLDISVGESLDAFPCFPKLKDAAFQHAYFGGRSSVRWYVEEGGSLFDT